MKKQTSTEIIGQLPITVFKTEGYFVADCSLLKLSSYGKTTDDALQNFEEALFLFLESCLARNTFEEVLQECGFRKKNKKMISPELSMNASISLDSFNEKFKKSQRQRV